MALLADCRDVADFGSYIRCLFGHAFYREDLVGLFSLQLDETGTDGLSPYVLVGGAVATADQWADLEAAWARRLAQSKIEAYHWKEFNDPHDKEFGNWNQLKKKQFRSSQEKIINNNTIFRAAVGIDGAMHANIKERMKGIRGFSPESDYSLCLRWLMFATCEQLAKHDAECRLSILVEDGPFAKGAYKTYLRVKQMTGPPKPAKHAHRLAGFGSAPKGERLSLEAADYIAGSELQRLLLPVIPKRKSNALTVLLDEAALELWYEGMIKVKEERRKHWREQRKTND